MLFMAQVQVSQAEVEVEVKSVEVRNVERVIIDLADAGEVRRFHRVLLAGAQAVEGPKSEAFAAELIEALGVTEESAAKQ